MTHVHEVLVDFARPGVIHVPHAPLTCPQNARDYVGLGMYLYKYAISQLKTFCTIYTSKTCKKRIVHYC